MLDNLYKHLLRWYHELHGLVSPDMADWIDHVSSNAFPFLLLENTTIGIPFRLKLFQQFSIFMPILTIDAAFHGYSGKNRLRHPLA